MTAPRFRFDPPPVELSPGLRWVLARAFGPAEAAVEETEGAVTAKLAVDLSLAGRIAARHPAARLVGELGEPAAAEIRRERARVAASEMQLEAALAAVDAAAAELRVPYAPVKGRALALGGYAMEASRPSVDVAILVPVSRLEGFQRELLARGFKAGGPAYEHQEATLAHEGGGAVELHRMLLGVRTHGKRSVGFDDLAQDELLVRLPTPLPAAVERAFGGRPRGDLPVPRRELLAAHALVHALAQHGLSPRPYPGLLLVGDLLDLGFRAGAGRSTLATIAPWIEEALAFEEAEAALDLATALASGDPEFLGAAGGATGSRPPARRLLDHMLASIQDPRYAESLKTRALEAPLSDRSKAGARAAVVAGALVPARGVTPDGEREGALAYLGRLLGRPLDLWRRWRSAKAAGQRED